MRIEANPWDGQYISLVQAVSIGRNIQPPASLNLVSLSLPYPIIPFLYSPCMRGYKLTGVFGTALYVFISIHPYPYKSFSLRAVPINKVTSLLEKEM